MTVLPYYMARRRLLASAGGGGGGAADVIVNFGTSDQTFSSAFVCNGVNFGPEAADRVLIFDMAQRSDSQHRWPQSVTIGGVAATRGGSSDPTTNFWARHATWAALVPEGESGQITVQMSGSAAGIAGSFVLYRVTGNGGVVTATDTAGVRSSGPAVVTAGVGDLVIGGSCRNNSNGVITLSGLTTRHGVSHPSYTHYGVHGADIASEAGDVSVSSDVGMATSATVYPMT